MKIFNALTGEEDSFYEGKADLIQTFNTQETEKFFVEEFIIKAVDNLHGFSAIESLSLSYLNTLEDKEIIQEGMTLGKKYELKGNFLVLSDFSSKEYKQITQMFYVGFLLEASRRFYVVLDGGLDVLETLLVADDLRETLLMRIKSDNITVATTKKEVQQYESKIIESAEKLSYTPSIIYTNFTFRDAEIKILTNNEEQERDNGKGGVLAYGAFLTNKELLNEIELIIYMA